MRALQQQIIDELGVKPAIDPESEVRERVNFLVDYAQSAHAEGFVLGISGGQDSTLTGRLGQLAAEKLRSLGHTCTFLAVRLPYGVQRDEADAQRALAFIKPDEVTTFNIKNAVDVIEQEFTSATGVALSDFVKGNVKARQRMVAQFAFAGQRNMLVVGTDHAAEAVTGFFTKFGDGATDVMPIAGLTKSQGAEMLKFLGADESFWLKTPTADLLDTEPGQSDEQSLGASYAEIDAYLRGETIDPAVAEMLERRYLQTAHKRALPVTPTDAWWNV